MKKVVFLLMLVSQASFANDPLKIEVKGKSFLSNEEIEIYFRNESEQNLMYVGVSLERYENEEWSIYRYNIGCSCAVKICKSSSNYFIANKLQYLKWDIDGKDCKAPESGRYRFSVFGDQMPNLNQPKYLGVSNEFAIK